MKSTYESFRYPISSLTDTAELAKKLARYVRPPMTIGLVGTLGTGKTQLVRFLVTELGVPAEVVTSPTYVLQQTYQGQYTIHHFDWYRLDWAAQVWDLGIDELYEQTCLVLIEWADKFPECLPDDCVMVALSAEEGDTRIAEVSGSGPRSCEVVRNMNKRSGQ